MNRIGARRTSRFRRPSSPAPRSGDPRSTRGQKSVDSPSLPLWFCSAAVPAASRLVASGVDTHRGPVVRRAAGRLPAVKQPDRAMSLRGERVGRLGPVRLISDRPGSSCTKASKGGAATCGECDLPLQCQLQCQLQRPGYPSSETELPDGQASKPSDHDRSPMSGGIRYFVPAMIMGIGHDSYRPIEARVQTVTAPKMPGRVDEWAACSSSRLTAKAS